MISHPFLELSGVLAFAHCIDSRVAPKSTMLALVGAHALGLKYFETDVHLSRDGTLLAFHDDKLDRVTDRRGVIAKLAHAEISQTRVSGTERIPLMAELLEKFTETRFTIEPESDATVDPLADA